MAAFAGAEYEAALRQAGARVDAVDKQTILLQIIRWGVEEADRQNVQSQPGRLDQEKIIPKLLALGAEINGGDNLGRTPLTEAVVYAPSLVKMLVEHGADPNSATHRQDSPLYLAIRANRADIARLLLAHGANVNARTLHGSAALDFARAHHQADILALLQKAGAKDE